MPTQMTRRHWFALSAAGALASCIREIPAVADGPVLLASVSPAPSTDAIGGAAPLESSSRLPLGSSADAASEPDHAAFLGTFNHTGGQADVEARDRAIEEVVKGMSVFARGIARDRLKAANPIAQKMVFTATDKTLTIAMDERAYTAPLDGSKVKVKGITGDELDLHLVVAPGSLKQVFSAEDKGRVNSFSFSGSKLVMHVRVHSEKLPKDLVYQLSYGRA
jgi:hypothetical protein